MKHITALLAIASIMLAGCAGPDSAGFTTALRQQALAAAVTYQATNKLPSGEAAKRAAIDALIAYLAKTPVVPATPPASVVEATSAAVK